MSNYDEQIAKINEQKQQLKNRRKELLSKQKEEKCRKLTKRLTQNDT